MAGIPMSALRRALSEMAAQGGLVNEMGAGLTRSGAAIGAPIGAIAQYANDPSEDNLAPGLLGGALMGAAGGRGLRTLMAAGAGAQGFTGGLRQALAEAASERGIGRAASREASHVDDAARFHGAGMEDDAFPDFGSLPSMREQESMAAREQLGGIIGGFERRPVVPQAPHLTTRERQTLEILMNEPGLSNEEIARRMYGQDAPDPRIVDIMIRKLLTKLGESGGGVGA